MKKKAKSEIGEDLFLNLPSEIVVNILSRLDVRTAMRGKCVCKPWLNLLTTPEFVKSHLSNSLPWLVVRMTKINLKLDTEKIVDGLVDLNHLNTFFHFELPFRVLSHSSINGLLFIKKELDHVLCNPITREYIKLPCPRQPSSITALEIYGFGVSKLSDQYKVVRISVEKSLQTLRHLYSGKSECQVYTLGTGLWRRIGKCAKFQHLVGNALMVHFCGNLHWWWQSTGASIPTQISRLDLETESFSTISGPPCEDSYKDRSISSLRGCLCVCDSGNWVIDIWVMKEYGDEKSWTKEFSMLTYNVWGSLRQLDPIEVFNNGDMFMTRRTDKLLYYTSNTNTVQQVDYDLIDSDKTILNEMRLYTPSFVSLKSFATENVRAFTMELGGGGGGGAASAPLRWCWLGWDRGREPAGHGPLLWRCDGRSLRLLREGTP